MTEAEKIAITERAAKAIREWDRPIVLNIDIGHAVGMISMCQLAMRHPLSRERPTAQMVGAMIRQLIDEIDPERGDLHKFLMMGFDPECDA